MNSKNKIVNNRLSTKDLVLLALLTALVAVLSYFGSYFKIGVTSLNPTLIPVVLGAAICGPLAGLILGGVSGAIYLFTVDATFFYGFSFIGTVIIVMLKGMMSGLCAGFAYKLLKKHNRYIAIVVSAVVAPIVNTGIFLIGIPIFFKDAELVIGSILLLNFLPELALNIVLSPTIARLLDIADKTFRKNKGKVKAASEKIADEKAAKENGGE